MKYSKQRELILQYVRSVKSHPTAEKVYKHIRMENPNISLGTVYRNLDFLSDLGSIKRIGISEGKDRFDGDVTSHYHAICVKCGSIDDIHINVDNISAMDEIAKEKLDCTVLSHDVIFHIICSKCK